MIQDPNRNTREAVRDTLALDDADVIDIGCGNGRVTAMLESARLRIGIEPSAEAVREAKDSVSGALFIRADGAELPVGDARFDIAVFSLSLHHHEDPAAALAEARRALKPGGHLLVIEPLPEAELERVCAVYHDESAELAAAETAMEQSDLEFLTRQTVEYPWMFDTIDELHRWLRSYYDTAADDALDDAVNAVVGGKVEDVPLGVNDAVSLSLLRAPHAP